MLDDLGFPNINGILTAFTVLQMVWSPGRKILFIFSLMQKVFKNYKGALQFLFSDVVFASR